MKNILTFAPAPQAPNQQAPVMDFISANAGITSRIGTLFIGRAVVPGTSNVFLSRNNTGYDCAHKDNRSYTESCLDVTGGANFANLIINQIAYWNGLTTVGTQGGLGGGGSSVASTLTVNSNGTNTGLLVSGLGYPNQANFAPRNLTTTVPVCAKADGTMVRCNEPEPMAYHWDVGNYGACNGQTYPKCNGNYPVSNGGACEGQWNTTTQGSCGGTYQGPQGQKVDWMGNPFNWSDGLLYTVRWENNQWVPTPMTRCATEPEAYDMRVNRNLDFNASSDNRACFTNNPPYSWPSELYEPSIADGMWHRVNVTSGPGGDRVNAGNSSTPGWINSVYLDNSLYQEGAIFSCAGPNTQQSCMAQNGGNNNCSWTPGETQTNYCAPATNQADCLARNAACSWNPRASTVSCAGPTNANECTAQHPNCSFAPGNPGTKTRTVVCKNASNQTVADQFCINTVGLKPSTSSSCGVSQGF
ncbi:MAG: hypothetical protein WBA61_01890 [Aequorivita sp.]